MDSSCSIDDVLMKHINKIFPTKLKKKGMPKEPVFVCSWNDEVQSYNQVIYSQSIVLKAIRNIQLPLILGNRN